MSHSANSFAGLRKSLKELKRGSGNESLHRMRVSIKKLRAVMRLCETLNPEIFKYEKEAKPYASIFKPAGEWRDLLNAEMRLLRYGRLLKLNITAMEGLTIINANHCAEKYRSKATKFNLKILERTEKRINVAIKDFDDETLRKAVLLQMNSYLEQSALTMQADHGANHLHDVRKLLKLGWYLRGFTRNFGNKQIDRIWGAEMQQVIRYLGDFQDTEVLQEYVAKCAKNRLVKTAIDRPTLEKLSVRIFADKVRNIQKSVSGLEKLLALRNSI